MSEIRDVGYLGDGVYWSFDGFYFWLKTERDQFTHEIALEPEMIEEMHQIMTQTVKQKGTIG